MGDFGHGRDGKRISNHRRIDCILNLDQCLHCELFLERLASKMMSWDAEPKSFRHTSQTFYSGLSCPSLHQKLTAEMLGRNTVMRNSGSRMDGHVRAHTHNLVSEIINGGLASDLKSNHIGKGIPSMSLLEERARETQTLGYGATWENPNQQLTQLSFIFCHKSYPEAAGDILPLLILSCLCNGADE